MHACINSITGVTSGSDIKLKINDSSEFTIIVTSHK